MINGLAEKLKKLRIEHGYSQRNVAKRLNVSPSIISSYENGERTPSVENLLALSYLYHCTTDYLLGKEIGQSELSVNLNQLTPKQRQLICELVESMRVN